MNRRYRRQTLLRSRRHRAGKLGACGCHPFKSSVVPVPLRVVVGAFCDPVWQIRKRRKVDTLPDISTYEEAGC